MACKSAIHSLENLEFSKNLFSVPFWKRRSNSAKVPTLKGVLSDYADTFVIRAKFLLHCNM
jgi:hypothetical protein